MPIYVFQCSCGLRFEASASMKAYKDPKPCPDCGKQAPRYLPEDVNGVFHQEISNGPVPQNTGISQLDAHIDRVIGQSAQQGWEVHNQRLSDKRQILRENPNVTGFDLSKNPDGSYKVLKPEERAIHERANTINSLALSSLKQKKETSTE
jgi:putative FmdB family regulatory protein